MLLDPSKLNEASPAEVLAEAAKAHLGLDRRFIRSFTDRPAESLPAVVAFSQRDRESDRQDLTAEIASLFRYWKAPEGVPFFVDLMKQDPEDVADEVVYSLTEIGFPSLEPLLKLYAELDESQRGEVAFVLANLHVHDPRILEILTARLDYDLEDSLFLLEMYRDPAARPAIEKAAAHLGAEETELKAKAAATLAALDGPPPPPDESEPYDIFADYPETEDAPVDLLDEEEREELLNHPVDSVRAVVASSFFNRQLSKTQAGKLLHLAQNDSSVTVRARAWETLINATEEASVVNPMLAALRNPALSLEERAGLLVGLAPETDRNEVRDAIADFYQKHPEHRAKALEAMWRSMHPSFRENFAKHLDDPDVEVRRGALWGVGYYGIKSSLTKVRELFDNEDLRNDALFSYALASPGEVSRGRMESLLSRIEKDAHGLSEMEEELVKAALDERLLLAGKETYFRQTED